jgi:hypothetical protein
LFIILEFQDFSFSLVEVLKVKSEIPKKYVSFGPEGAVSF